MLVKAKLELQIALNFLINRRESFSDVSSANIQHIWGKLMEISSSSTTMAAARSGKARQSVGHMAKTAVAEAKLLGVDLPKNAQGMAASAIARGAEAGSVFAAIVVSEPTIGSNESDIDLFNPDGTGALSGQIDAGETDPKANSSYNTASEIMGDGALNDAETALALLNDAV